MLKVAIYHENIKLKPIIVTSKEYTLMKYEWLLFDADGTLFDYNKSEVEALKKTFEQLDHEFKPGYAKTYRQINEHMWLEFELGRISQDLLRTRRFELLFQAINIGSDPEEFSREYLENLAHGSDLIAGAEKTLKALYENVGLVIITNGIKDVQRSRLKRSAIGNYFSNMIISEEVGASKPDRRIFDAAFNSMNNPQKREVLIVGDSLTSDIRGGMNYGIATCWFNPAQKPCDLDIEIQYEITSLSELLHIVG
jgi:2-haloacid dehalogenase